MQYNLRLRRNQLMNKRPDTDPIVLDDIDPTSDWLVETQEPEFDPDFDIELDATGDLTMEADPLLPVPSSVHADADVESRSIIFFSMIE